MKNSRFKIKSFRLLFGVLCLAFGIVSINAQSTNIEFPTPVTTNEIKGKIAARDLGDSRLTTHYYYFNGNQGDIFIKILTTNLDGDIDVFIADTLRPVTKINVYSDTSDETGREIYLRKPEKLILRVEGRTPSDAPATYSIKFEGSFLAIAPKRGSEEPKLPVIESETEGAVKVNSVGTIIKTPLKTTPPPKTTTARTTAKTPEKRTTTAAAPKSVSTIEDKSKSTKTAVKKVEVPVTEDLPKETEAVKKAPKTNKTTKTGTSKAKTTPPRKTNTAANKAKTTTTTEADKKPTAAEELAKALGNVKLLILLKDGTKIERPMNEVLRVNVDKGILTVISKDGSIKRYSILDISKMTIE